MQLKNFTLKSIILVLIFCSLFTSFASDTQYPDSSVLIYEFELDDEVAAPSARRTQLAIEQAYQVGAHALLIRMNTYGGELVSADSIRTKLLRCRIPVIVFIDNNAASAGALIALACDKIYMTQSSNIGAATVVNQTGEAVPDKYQSYMRAMMRSTAEANGRDPRIAEAMVDPSVEIMDVIDEGKVLTLTASEALALELCDDIVKTVADVMAKEGINDYKIESYTATTIDKIIAILIHPAVSSVLILVMLGGLYFELQTPGVGFPIAAAALAALLYFAPLYIEGLAENWEILLFVAGLVLIAVEIFVLPGFGVAGISGIALVLTAFVLSMVGNVGFDFTFVPDRKLGTAVVVALIGMIGSILPIILFGRQIINSPVFRRIVLSEELPKYHTDSSAAPTHANKELIGKTGKTVSVLNPGGKVDVDGEIHQAIAQVGFIDRGVTVKVIADEGMNLLVKQIQ